MPYGKALVDTVESSGNLAITGNTSITGNVTTTGTISSSVGTTYPIVLGTAQTVTSGTSVDFTGIPSWVRRITLTVTGMSFAAAGTAAVRIGSGSLATTGYTLSLQTVTNAATPSVTTQSIYLGVFATATAAGTVSGQTVLVLQDPSTNKWVSQGTAIRQADNIFQTWTGFISLAGTLSQISLVTTVSTFDAGTVNILYE